MDIEVHTEGKGCTPAKRKFDGLPKPVSPCESGKGLPYAPVDWPNPGDIWGWRVGKRIKGNGSYHDRFLIAPERLRSRPTKKLELQSKPHVERYLRSEFPDANVDAFFASFIWEIPAEGQSGKKGQITPSPQPIGSEKVKCKRGRGQISPSPQPIGSEKVEPKMEKTDGIFKRTRKASLRKGQISTGKCDTEIAVEVSSADGTVASGVTAKGFESTGFGNGQVSDSNAAVSHVNSPVDCKPEAVYPLEESQAGLTPEEFDSYLNSLDEILALPLATVETSYKKESIIEVRKRLSSLLLVGYPNLVSSNKLNELTALAYKLQNDPCLGPEERSMLKLIEEIPLTSKCFLEAKEVSVQADKFFANLDTKIASVASLRSEYNTSKEEIEALQAEEASAMLKILELDQQIASLQSLRQAQTQTIRVTNKKIVQFTSIQKRVMDCLPKIVHEVQVAKSQKPEWELKKKKSADLEAEILAKFAPLGSFSF